MKKIVSILILVFLFTLLSTTPVSAVCPVCTVAVGVGLGLSRLIGIDDVVSSLWIGGLILSFSLWTINWLHGKKEIKNLTVSRLINLGIILSMYLLTLLPLAFTKVIGHPLNKFWGIDKIVLGIIFGSLGFFLGVWLDKKIREIKGKVLFDFQRVVFPVAILLILSFIFYFLTK